MFKVIITFLGYYTSRKFLQEPYEHIPYYAINIPILLGNENVFLYKPNTYTHTI